MEKIKNLLAIIALITAIFQMFVSNDQRAKENFATTAKICELSQQVSAQNVVIEAAFNTKVE